MTNVPGCDLFAMPLTPTQAARRQMACLHRVRVPPSFIHSPPPATSKDRDCKKVADR